MCGHQAEWRRHCLMWLSSDDCVRARGKARKKCFRVLPRCPQFLSICLLLQEIIQDYDEKGVGIGAARPGRRRGAPTRLRHSNGSLPANRSSGSLVDGVRGGDVRHLQSSFDGPYQVS